LLKKLYSQNSKKKKRFFKKSVSTVIYIVLLTDVYMFETCRSTQPNVKSHWLRNTVITTTTGFEAGGKSNILRHEIYEELGRILMALHKEPISIFPLGLARRRY